MKRIHANLLIICCTIFYVLSAQPPKEINWTKDGNGYYINDTSERSIKLHDLVAGSEKVIVNKNQLKPVGTSMPLTVRNFFFSDDGKKLLIYTNSKKVWRYDTKGDYWLLDLNSSKLTRLGKSLPVSSLMFAKFSSDGTKVAYVSGHNIYVENLSDNSIKQLTFDGTRQLINGTFDWVYEEEFFCPDGFRWSPDGKYIAYWQIDARNTKDYLMINNTDSIYPFIVPVEYPVAGESPSPFKIGVVDIAAAKTTWMDIPTDPVLQSYVPRMEWANNSDQLIVQHLNRKQNQSDIMLCDVSSGRSNIIYHEADSAWIDILSHWDYDYSYGGWDWLNDGKEFLWASEKDGWRRLYRISRDGKTEKLITNGNYDVIDISAVDEQTGFVYFLASPENATQKYLYRTKLDGEGIAERLSPKAQQGTHKYVVSPTGKFSFHKFSNYYTPMVDEWVSLPQHKVLGEETVKAALDKSDRTTTNFQFFKIKTIDGVEMDGWMAKPGNFDSTKKYPVVFFVYTEPWGATVLDFWGIGQNFLYPNMTDDGYIYISLDGRGTPAPKGAAWRKCVYRKMGIVNIHDQAMAAKQILQWSFIDTSRVAVWGWSGGGSATLNLMFQYPEIYKTGIAIAAVVNQPSYNNIYQERYMGLPEENREDLINGSPITYAKNLQGHLLYIHGTGDDNVHYQNAEILINELVKYNKQFQMMSYPNRSHGLSEGEGTSRHLQTLYTQFLNTWCPPGPK